MSDKQYEELYRLVQALGGKMMEKFDRLEERVAIIEGAVIELRDDLRKVLKFVPVEHADFPNPRTT
jgi:hypothetical protein